MITIPALILLAIILDVLSIMAFGNILWGVTIATLLYMIILFVDVILDVLGDKSE